MFRKIMVPLDGSPFAEVSLPCAEEMAGRMNSQIILVNVLEQITARYENLLKCYLESRSNTLKQRIADNGGRCVSVEPLLVKQAGETDQIGDGLLGMAIGHPAVDIINTAVSQKASLIIMATHGYSGFQQFTMSNVADTIVRRCGLPVLLVRPSRQANPSICRNILVPLDGSSLAERAVAVVEEMAEKMVGQEMKVSLVHVVQEGHRTSTPEPSATFLTFVSHPAWHAASHGDELYYTKVREYLGILGQKLSSNGVSVSTTVCSGKPDVEIGRLVDENNTGLVVMSSHSRTGIAKYVIGSVADRVLRTVDASLLLLRPDKSQLVDAE
jgi:nucleotide-binding universal stress UspA family protein